MKKDNTSRQIKTIIAKECGLEHRVTNQTPFMSSQVLSYFDCMGAMYTLQHKLHVSLPESKYAQYATVGNLVKDIVKQLKVRSK